MYWRLKVELGKAPSVRNLGIEARVGKSYAAKISNEIKSRGRIAPVEDLRVERDGRRNERVNCQCISLCEQDFLLQLRVDEPTRDNDSYVAAL